MREVTRGLRWGLVIGLVFGCVNLVTAWLRPLDDDSPGALLRFYGPMFAIWALAAFVSVRRNGGVLSGVGVGTVVAFATFCVYYFAVIVRVNVLLYQLTDRLDWQTMMARFRVSGYESLRVFINLDYLKGAPFKIAVASAIGALMGLLGGSLGRMFRIKRTVPGKAL